MSGGKRKSVLPDNKKIAEKKLRESVILPPAEIQEEPADDASIRFSLLEPYEDWEMDPVEITDDMVVEERKLFQPPPSPKGKPKEGEASIWRWEGDELISILWDDKE